MNRVWTPLCAHMGIDVPIFGFAHDVQVVAAITNAGGYGVYGATRRFPHEIEEELKQIRALVDTSMRIRTGHQSMEKHSGKCIPCTRTR